MVAVGTSGYNFAEWKGRFYPSDLAASRMLAYYAARFDTVEINYTFYRMPTEKIVVGWMGETPTHFRFTLKAPKRITHDRRLKDCGDLVTGFCSVAALLEARLAVLLFQLPPNLKCDLGLFDAFLAVLPPRLRAAFEFRHPSWLNDEVYGRLQQRNLALCIADSEQASTPMVATADYGYLRLRDDGYTPEALDAWAARVVAWGDRWQDTYVYFKHEDEARGPEFATTFRRAVNERLGS